MTLLRAKPTSAVHSTILRSKKTASVRLQTDMGSGKTQVSGMASNPVGFPMLPLPHPARNLPVLTGERNRTRMMYIQAEVRRLMESVPLLPRVPVPVRGSPEWGLCPHRIEPGNATVGTHRPRPRVANLLLWVGVAFAFSS